MRLSFRPLREMEVRSSAELRHKEVVYLTRRRQALFLLRDYMWGLGTLLLKRVAAERHWGTVPQDIVRRVQESKRNRRDTRLSLAGAWGLWPEPFQQTLEEWDEVYLAEFPEVVDRPERPGSVRWRSFYSKYTRDFLANPSDIVIKLMKWVPQYTHTLHFPRKGDEIDYLDAVVAELDARVGRDPSQLRPLRWEVRLKREASFTSREVLEGESELSEGSIARPEVRSRKARRTGGVKPMAKSKPVLLTPTPFGVETRGLPPTQSGSRELRGRGAAVVSGDPPYVSDMLEDPLAGGTREHPVAAALRLMRAHAITFVNSTVNLLSYTQRVSSAVARMSVDEVHSITSFDVLEGMAHAALVPPKSAQPAPPCSVPVAGYPGPTTAVRAGSSRLQGPFDAMECARTRQPAAGVQSVMPLAAVAQPAAADGGLDAQYRALALRMATAYIMALRSSPGAMVLLRSQAERHMQGELPTLLDAALALASDAASLQRQEAEMGALFPMLATSDVPGAPPPAPSPGVGGAGGAVAVAGLSACQVGFEGLGIGSAVQEPSVPRVARASAGPSGVVAPEGTPLVAVSALTEEGVATEKVTKDKVLEPSTEISEAPATAATPATSRLSEVAPIQSRSIPEGVQEGSTGEVISSQAGKMDSAMGKAPPARPRGRAKSRPAKPRAPRIREGVDIVAGPTTNRKQGSLAEPVFP